MRKAGTGSFVIRPEEKYGYTRRVTDSASDIKRPPVVGGLLIKVRENLPARATQAWLPGYPERKKGAPKQPDQVFPHH